MEVTEGLSSKLALALVLLAALPAHSEAETASTL